MAGSTVKIVGHRGAPRLFAENSLAGLTHAAGLGIDAVELDVQVTSDGALVLAHDPWLDRITETGGIIADQDRAGLEQVTLTRERGTGLAFLPEVLEALAAMDCELHVEIKRDHRGLPYPDIAAKILAALEATGTISRAILTSFFPDDLRAVRALDNTVPILASINLASASALGGLEAAIRTFQAIDPACMIAFEKSLLRYNLDLCLALVARDRIGVWVVNDEDDLAHWLGHDIRQLTTDQPDVALGVRATVSGTV